MNPCGRFCCLLASVILLATTLAAQQQQPSQTQPQPRTRCGKWDTSKIDPSYTKLANATGGQVIALDPCDAGSGVALAATTTGKMLLSINDRLTNAEKTYRFTVDGSVARVAVSATGVSTFRIEQPNAATIVAGTPDIQHHTTLNGQVYTVEDPQPGTWKVLASGNGDFTLRVHATSRSAPKPGGAAAARSGSSPGSSAAGTGVEVSFSEIDFWGFRFLELGGRPGHQGYFPIPGYPIAGATSQVEATISGEFSTVQFEFRTPAGEVLQKFRLARGSEDRHDDQRYGEVQVPEVPFQVYAIGLDMHGHPYQRTLAHVISPQKFSVRARRLNEVHPGQTTAFTVEVKNYGPAGSFRVSGYSKHNFLRSITPERLALGTNETAQLTVTIQVPPEASGGDEITLTATAADNPELFNFAVVEALVLRETQH